jgi:NAD(P)-dependent dehydrogenase (short-subunit alcohol dehydrogenase family)
MNGPRGKVAVVTGGSSGTGQSIAIRLGREDATLSRAVAVAHVRGPGD